MAPTKTNFNSIVSGYELFAAFIDKNDDRIQEYTARLLKKVLVKQKIENPIILELGFGTGKTTAAILSQIPSARITAIDEGKNFLPYAKKSVGKLGMSHTNFVISKVEDFLPNLDRYDSVISVLTLHNLSRTTQKSSLQKIYKSLNKQGILILAEKLINRPTREYDQVYFERVASLEKFNEMQKDNLYSFFTAHEIEDHKRLVSEKEMTQWLRKVGFTTVVIPKRFGLYSIVIAYK